MGPAVGDAARSPHVKGFAGESVLVPIRVRRWRRPARLGACRRGHRIITRSRRLPIQSPSRSREHAEPALADALKAIWRWLRPHPKTLREQTAEARIVERLAEGARGRLRRSAAGDKLGRPRWRTEGPKRSTRITTSGRGRLRPPLLLGRLGRNHPNKLYRQVLVRLAILPTHRDPIG